MAPIPLKDILINARQESHRMRHYFMGVEHLFIGLLEIKSGLASSILTEMGLSPEYVIDAIRRKAGKGSKHRLWAGIPSTPRTEVVLEIAQEIAREHNRQTIQERDLLIAILEEDDSIPTRVLRSLGVEIGAMRADARARAATRSVTQPFVAIDIVPNAHTILTNDQLFVLRRMFHGYTRVRVEKQLTGGYTSSTLLIVTPIHLDGREDATVVVKIGPADAILDETQRYDRYVRNTLPPLTARVEDRPIAPDASDLAAMKYTLLTGEDGNSRDMRAVVHEWTGSKLGHWLHHGLHRNFAEKWWKQSKPYRFEVWQEYDWVLPPMLTLELHNSDTIPHQAKELSIPIRQRQFSSLEYGDIIVIKNFLVQKVDKEEKCIQLALSHGTNNTNRPYQIEVQGIDFEEDTYYRGEIVERVVGRIWSTRDDQLRYALNELNPDFDTSGDKIKPYNDDRAFPNPLLAYKQLLDRVLVGSLSTIHGDLHLGNIMLGTNDTALLIDFGRTREGHTIFDWATLEVSIISEIIAPLVEDTWDGARELMQYLEAIIDPQQDDSTIPEDIAEKLQSLNTLRAIVTNLLAEPTAWEEYYIGLSMVALRAINWRNMPLNSRRTLFLVSALAMHEALKRLEIVGIKADTSPEITEYED